MFFSLFLFPPLSLSPPFPSSSRPRHLRALFEGKKRVSLSLCPVTSFFRSTFFFYHGFSHNGSSCVKDLGRKNQLGETNCLLKKKKRKNQRDEYKNEKNFIWKRCFFVLS